MINKQALRKKMLTSGLKKKCGPKRHTKRPVLCRRKGSAFSAIATDAQPIGSTGVVQVLFDRELFDLANEYNPATSIFTPKRSGVYVFFASMNYRPSTEDAGVVSLAIVAGSRDIQFDSEPIDPINGNQLDVAGIANLRAGERVAVLAVVSAGSGVIEPFGTRFEGSRTQ
ncbi:C1q-like domain-containing protein [Paenibacillus sp. 2TAB19]|uniref:C1q-like domain-containing protein n=1 Tax=Paenibacillus sp. 2TAB19 TaxID=3233003 RepID=UPI003F9C843D